MSESRTRTWLLVIAPVVVAAGIFARPFVSDFTDDEVLATTIAEATRLWEVAGLLMAAGAALLAFALPAAVQQVGGGESLERWVRIAATTGAVLLALQVGLVGLGAAAASRIGANVVEFLDVSSGLELGMLMVGLLALVVAWVGVIRAMWTSAAPMRMNWIVTVGGGLAALGPLYPASPGEYSAALGTAAALWTIAAHQWLGGVNARPGR